MFDREIIYVKDNLLCFGDYELKEKKKVDGFEFNGDKYKVKSYKEITRLEKNDKMIIETVPGSKINNFDMVRDKSKIMFESEGFDETQIFFELEENKSYKIEIDGILIGVEKSNAFGKFCFSVGLCEKAKRIKIEKC